MNLQVGEPGPVPSLTLTTQRHPQIDTPGEDSDEESSGALGEDDARRAEA